MLHPPYTGLEPGLTQTIAMISVPLLQGIAVIVLSLILLLRRKVAS